MPSFTQMMRLRTPIMLAARPTHSCSCSWSVSRRSCPVAASSGPASSEGRRKKNSDFMMGLIMAGSSCLMLSWTFNNSAEGKLCVRVTIFRGWTMLSDSSCTASGVSLGLIFRPGLFLWGDAIVVLRGRNFMGTKSQKQTQSPSTASAILVVMYIAAFVAAFNENIINVALHDIMAAFSVSATTAQWLVSGYMIVTSIFTAIMAFLSGRFSTRKLLFFACGCMVAGEVLCLVAPSFSVLLPSRILRAAGSGILFPLMMNVVLSCAPREKLGLYLSLGGACITLGPAFGPVISGLMCTLFGWRAVFVGPLVGGIAVAAAGVKHVQNVGERSNTTLDILSVVLAVP